MTTIANKFERVSRKSLAFAAAFALILGNGGYQAFDALSTKADQEEQAFSQVKRFKAEYELLKPTQEEWLKVLTPAQAMADLYHVYQSLHLAEAGLATSFDHMQVERVEPLSPNGVSIHASRLCLKTSTEQNLSLTAPRFSPDLLQGLSKLSERRDVQIGSIKLTTQNNQPTALLDLCLVYRN